MRVKKANFGYQDSTQWTKYMYDGQMPVEETEYSSGQAGTFTTVRKNALGARGIDRIETVTSSGSSVAYPVYDGHGNMVATLAKSGSGYQIGNRRSFGAWGDVRQGAASGDPKGGYVANLGHLDDDESGLTYMRARYYEASSGRFISEDNAREYINWFSYCANNPILAVDYSGNNAMLQAFFLALIGSAIFSLAQWSAQFMHSDPKFHKEGPGDIFEALISWLGAAFVGNLTTVLMKQEGQVLTGKALIKFMRGSFFANALIGGGVGVALAFYHGWRQGEIVSELMYLEYGI